jgi:hypothetical protein
MPVIIPEHDYDRWLRAEPDRPPIDLLRPFNADKMTAWKVDKAVGNVKNDSPELIEPAKRAVHDLAPRFKKCVPDNENGLLGRTWRRIAQGVDSPPCC